MKKEQLKKLIRDLTGMYNNKDIEVTDIIHSMYSSQCTPCQDYGDNVFENITIVSKNIKKPEHEES